MQIRALPSYRDRHSGVWICWFYQRGRGRTKRMMCISRLWSTLGWDAKVSPGTEGSFMKLGISHIWDHNAMYEKTLSYNVKTKSREGWGFKKKKTTFLLILWKCRACAQRIFTIPPFYDALSSGFFAIETAPSPLAPLCGALWALGKGRYKFPI